MAQCWSAAARCTTAPRPRLARASLAPPAPMSFMKFHLEVFGFIAVPLLRLPGFTAFASPGRAGNTVEHPLLWRKLWQHWNRSVKHFTGPSISGVDRRYVGAHAHPAATGESRATRQPTSGGPGARAATGNAGSNIILRPGSAGAASIALPGARVPTEKQEKTGSMLSAQGPAARSVIHE